MKDIAITFYDRLLKDYRDVEESLDEIILQVTDLQATVVCKVRWTEGHDYSTNDRAALCVQVPAEAFPDAVVNKAACEAVKDMVLREFDKAVGECRRLRG